MCFLSCVFFTFRRRKPHHPHSLGSFFRLETWANQRRTLCFFTKLLHGLGVRSYCPSFHLERETTFAFRVLLCCKNLFFTLSVFLCYTHLSCDITVIRLDKERNISWHKMGHGILIDARSSFQSPLSLVAVRGKLVRKGKRDTYVHFSSKL